MCAGSPRELLIETMTIARRHKILMPQELSIYYKTIMTVDARSVSDLAPDYDWLSDLPEFFTQGLISDLRERVMALAGSGDGDQVSCRPLIDRCK